MLQTLAIIPSDGFENELTVTVIIAFCVFVVRTNAAFRGTVTAQDFVLEFGLHFENQLPIPEQVFLVILDLLDVLSARFKPVENPLGIIVRKILESADANVIWIKIDVDDLTHLSPEASIARQ